MNHGHFFRTSFPNILGHGVLFFLLILPSIKAHAFDCAFVDPAKLRYQIVVGNSQTPCPAGYETIMSTTEYAQFLQMQADIAALQASGGSAVGAVFDPVLAGSLWMFALTVILGCWLLAKNAGIIINMIKRW